MLLDEEKKPPRTNKQIQQMEVGKNNDKSEVKKMAAVGKSAS